MAGRSDDEHEPPSVEALRVGSVGPSVPGCNGAPALVEQRACRTIHGGLNCFITESGFETCFGWDRWDLAPTITVTVTVKVLGSIK